MAAGLNTAVQPLIVIVGPTASGKTAAALRIAGEVGGEIVCADSRTIYKGLDIGTAKPTDDERRLIPHHLLDVITPEEQYSAARFQRDARNAIEAIRARGKVPLLVGGSGLYVDSILFSYEFGTPADLEFRSKLEALSLDKLFRYSNQHNITLPNNLYNKRYVIRAIEQNGVNDLRSDSLLSNTLIVGIATESDRLKQRIYERAQNIFSSGVVEEAELAANQYGWEANGLNAPAYKMCHQLKQGLITLDQAAEGLARADWRLSRRQRTWFKRNPYIEWVALDQIDALVHSIFTRSRA